MADAPPPWRATSRLMAGVLGGLKAACAAGGWFRKTLENGSRYSGFDINLLPAKIGLDNGVHFRHLNEAWKLISTRHSK
jgi:hypothetical protein